MLKTYLGKYSRIRHFCMLIKYYFYQTLRKFLYHKLSTSSSVWVEKLTRQVFVLKLSNATMTARSKLLRILACHKFSFALYPNPVSQNNCITEVSLPVP